MNIPNGRDLIYMQMQKYCSVNIVSIRTFKSEIKSHHKPSMTRGIFRAIIPPSLALNNLINVIRYFHWRKNPMNKILEDQLCIRKLSIALLKFQRTDPIVYHVIRSDMILKTLHSLLNFRSPISHTGEDPASSFGRKAR